MRRKLFIALNYIFCSLLGLLILIPIATAVIGGFKTQGQLAVDPFGWPSPFQLENYWNILTSEDGLFGRSFMNSFIITGGTVVLDLLLACMAGFALSRIPFKGRSLVYNFFMIGLLFPFTVAILPLYLQLRNLGLLNSFTGVILSMTAFNLPWHIMLLRGFFKAIPDEIEEASRMDGCGYTGFFIKITLPLAKPALATVAVLTLVGSWNNYFLPLLVLDDAKKFPLPMGILNYMGQYMVNWNQILAFISLAMIPAVIFYLLTQKYIVAGLTGGSVKG